MIFTEITTLCPYEPETRFGFAFWEDEETYECPKCGEDIECTIDFIYLVACPNCDNIFEK